MSVKILAYFQVQCAVIFMALGVGGASEDQGHIVLAYVCLPVCPSVEKLTWKLNISL